MGGSIYTIELTGMEFRAYHGCYELERKVGNRFSVDLYINTALGEVAERDDVTLAVNYLSVYEALAEQMRITNCTIEAVAQRIISTVKGMYPEIDSIECRVSKLSPPLGGKIDRVSVVLRG